MKIVTSLSFRGECREAFEHYANVLGGKITAAMPYGDGLPGMPADAKIKDWLMHCWLEVGDQALMGADMDVAWAPNIDKPKNGFDVTLHTDSINKRCIPATCPKRSAGTSISRRRQVIDAPSARRSGRRATAPSSTASASPG